MKSIRFIHTADLHLDSPFRGFSHIPSHLYEQVKESTFLAFEKIVDAAIERKVDFILIVGDLFDAEDRSIRAQIRLIKQLERLDQVGIPAIISYGNHDYIGIKDQYLTLPKNTFVFHHKVEVIEQIINGHHIHFYGFSYPKRHIYERKIEQYVKKLGADFHIGLLHGQIEGGSTVHQPYAPFTKNELLEKDLDYWALGHIHQNSVIHSEPPIVYPGNIQGRHRKEHGKKSCYEVQLFESGETKLTEIDTAIIRWENIKIDIQQDLSATELYNRCKQIVIELQEQMNSGLLLDIELHVKDDLVDSIRSFIDHGELLELLQDEFATMDSFIWVDQLMMIREGKFVKHNEFSRALLELSKEFVEEEPFERATEPLTKHSSAARYMDVIETEERENIVEAAREIIVQKMNGR